MSKWSCVLIAYVVLVLLIFDRFYPVPILSKQILRGSEVLEEDEGGEKSDETEEAEIAEDSSETEPDPNASALINGTRILSGTNVSQVEDLKVEDDVEVSDETEPESRTSALINGTNRFVWYREQLMRKMNITELKTTLNISQLYAYEFEHEIVVTTTPWGRMGSQLFCRYLDENDEELGDPFESFTYPEYIVNCEKRKGTRKIGLSIRQDSEFEAIPIIDRMLKKPKYELSMCVAPMYGEEPKWLLFIEMIEHYKLQGVQHFYLHIHHASEYDLKVINDYVRTGELEVHYLLERDQRDDSWWQNIHIADCLIWSRGESKWTISADLDERILTTNYAGTLLDYVRVVAKDESIGSMQFQQQWILKTELMPERYEGEKQIDQWMPTHRWHNSTGIGEAGHTAKCIIDPSKVFIMFVHYVTQFFPGPDGLKYQQIEVEPDVGVVRHYRDQSLGSWGERWLNDTLQFGPLRMTDYPKELIGELTERVKRRAQYVYDNVD